MNKPFKTYRQQLGILRSRGLIINNGSKAIKCLKTYGYYNIINGYKDIFLDSNLTKQTGNDCYKVNTKFEDIYALYTFDRNLRAILLKYILKMEALLKTKVAYFFSEKYKKNFSYLDINNFDNNDPTVVSNIIATISDVIKKNNKKGNQIYHYLDNHKELPLWVLTTKMSLGNIVHFYNAMKMAEKLKVVDEIVAEFTKEYKINLGATPKNLQEGFVSNMFDFINKFRNICAHEERLYSQVIKNNKKPLGIVHFHKANAMAYSSRCSDLILVLGLFLSKKEYSCMIKEIEKEIDILNSQLPSNIFNQVLIKMGFSKNWKGDISIP